MPKKVVRLPSNPAISAAIIQRNRDRIIGASFSIGRRYLLLPEDREELISHVHMKISKVDWREKFREDLWWVVENIPHPGAYWTPEECARVFNGYAYTLIRKSMLDEVRRIKSGGLSGLGLHPLDSIQPHDPYGFDGYRENQESEDFTDSVEPSADGQADRTAANQIAQIAQQMLSAEEWVVCSMTFGFDGGGSRTPTQVAREIQKSRKHVQATLDQALVKMRMRVEPVREMDGSKPGDRRDGHDAVGEPRSLAGEADAENFPVVRRG